LEILLLGNLLSLLIHYKIGVTAMGNKIKSKKLSYYLNLVILLLAIVIGILASHFYSMQRAKADETQKTIQQDLAKEVVRFHVLAASNSEIDQARKLLVKNAVLEYMAEPLNRSESAKDALAILEENQDKIAAIARQTLLDNGCSDPVTTYIGDTYFPVKTYCDTTFPAGTYTAFRIVIGEGEGNNWWCVLYPPLCFIDITHGVLPPESKAALKNVLTEEEYTSITDGSISQDKIDFEFRILTFLN
jgi:stage II sporulation protein R